MMLNGMALFAGIGGIELGLRKYVRTVCYVEKDNYAVGIIRNCIKEGRLQEAPIWDDVKTFDGKQWHGFVDVISGGFPCQDISVAGKGRGIKKDTRSGLWFEMLRIINEVRPSFVFVENVSALTNRGLDIVLGQLSEAGYDARWTDLRASDVGAPHRRERMFILAYTDTNSKRKNKEARSIRETQREVWRKCERGQPVGCYKLLGGEKDVANTNRSGSGENKQQGELRTSGVEQSSEDSRETKEREIGKDVWQTDPADIDPSSESYVGRVADGVPNRVDRIKCLGNAVVPKQAERAWEILTNMRSNV